MPRLPADAARLLKPDRKRRPRIASSGAGFVFNTGTATRIMMYADSRTGCRKKFYRGAILARKTRDDRITLAGIRIYPHIGTTPEEKSNPQECELDLSIWGNFEAAATADSIDKSIDYCRVLEVVQEIAGAREYALVETLGYGISRAIIQKFPVNRVNVTLRKRPAILLNQIEYVEIEVEEP
jgi:7,8-dihydroneopterin aldolase/epimerase/oxygenase